MIQTRQLDLDLIAEFDDWLIIEPDRTEVIERARNLLEDATWNSRDLGETRPSRSSEERYRRLGEAAV